MSANHSFCIKACARVEDAGGKTVRYFADQRADLYRCEGCGYATFRPLPDDQLLERYYGGPWTTPTAAEQTAKEYFAVDWAPWVIELKLQAQLAGTAWNSARIHDVGCGVGALVLHLAKQGLRATGNDPSGDSINAGQARGADMIACADLETYLKKDPGPYDVFFLSHSLEHMREPQADLDLMRKHLSQNGIIVIRVPNGLHAASRRGRFSNYYWCTFPNHLHYFTPKSFECLFDSVGLKLIDVKSLLREEDPNVLCETLLGLPFSAVADWHALLQGIVANGLGCELQAVAARKDAPAQQTPTSKALLHALGTERVGGISGLTPPQSADEFRLRPQQSGLWSYDSGSKPFLPERSLQRENEFPYYVGYGLDDGLVVWPWQLRLSHTQYCILSYTVPGTGNEEQVFTVGLDCQGSETRNVPYEVVISLNGEIIHREILHTGRLSQISKIISARPSSYVRFAFKRMSDTDPGHVQYAAAVTPIVVHRGT